MGKSIRSKIKRKHRAEFRKTIGTEAFVKTQKIVQERLEGNIEKQTLKSIDKISSALSTDATTATSSAIAEQMLVEQETDTTIPATASLRGENKVIVNKRSRKKQKHSYHMKGMVGTKGATKRGQLNGSSTAMVVVSEDKPRPRFFCKF